MRGTCALMPNLSVEADAQVRPRGSRAPGLGRRSPSR